MATQDTVPGSRSLCPIATTLDVVGDSWSLVLIRDMLIGKKRYGEFLASPEGITTNILASRLKKLEAQGLIERRAYQTNPPRYEYHLTDMGRDLHPALQEICRWANRYFGDTWVPPAAFMKPIARGKN